MKSTRAKEYIEEWIFDAADLVDADGVGCAVVRRCDAVKAVERAEAEIRYDLLRWRDPNEERPENGVDVLVKCSSGSCVVDFYAAELNCFFGEHATYMKVIGWRPICEE